MSIPITPKSQLRQFFTEKYRAIGLLPSSEDDHQRGLNYLFLYMDYYHLEYYSQDVSNDYIAYTQSNPNFSNYRKKRNLRTVDILNRFLLGKPYSAKRVRAKSTSNITQDLLDMINQFTKSLEDKRLSDKTIKLYKDTLISFATSQILMDCKSFRDLTRENILYFVSSSKNAYANKLQRLRKFLGFLHETGTTNTDFSDMFANVRVLRREKLPSYYSKEEIRCLEQSIDRNCAIGKRDYAIILLASRLGLRSSDIRTLTFSNFDWDKNEINLIQYKTKKYISLPLLSEVGDAIIDYIRYARPKTNCKEIFLTFTRPYRPLNSASCSSIVSQRMFNAGIDCKYKHRGMHCLRHSLATTLMNNGVSMPVISETLGHTTSESTMYYLGVNINNLLDCSLAVPEVNDNFYNQKGGIFYV